MGTRWFSSPQRHVEKEIDTNQSYQTCKTKQMSLSCPNYRAERHPTTGLQPRWTSAASLSSDWSLYSQTPQAAPSDLKSTFLLQIQQKLHRGWSWRFTLHILPDCSVNHGNTKHMLRFMGQTLPRPLQSPGPQILFCPHAPAETLAIPATLWHSGDNCDINGPGKGRAAEEMGVAAGMLQGKPRFVRVV